MLSKAYRAVLRFFEKFYWIFFAAALLTLAFYCFRCLDVRYVDSWDEARHGVNAYEMIQNGDYIWHTYNYQVDDWNLKPSVSYWGIVLGFKLFGYSVFGLRFCSALAYLLTGAAVSLFARRYSKEASILVLGFFCANTLPLSAHLARSGDADSLYLLFFTVAMLAMFQIRENHRKLYLCGLMFSLAFLTKSWHAGMIAVIGGLYLLAARELFRLKRKEWAGFLASIFTPLVLWFGWRYTRDGFTFLKQMLETDLLARTGSVNFEGHEFPFSFYYDTVFGNEAYIYRWLMLFCVAGGVFALLQLLWKLWKKHRGENFGKLPARRALEDAFGFLLWFFVPFLGFSLVRTKLIWYCYPAIIPLFLASAILLGSLLRIPVMELESQLEDSEDRKRLRTQSIKRVSAALISWITAFATIFLVAYYMRDTYLTVIRGAHGDDFQLFIQESTERDSDYAGRTAYVCAATEDPADVGSWDQNMLFLAEISGDFHCRDGGVEAFLQEESPAVLYVDRERYAEYQEKLEDSEVLYLNEEYVLFGN